MSIAALIIWIVTALGGFYLLGNWLRRGGMRQQASGVTRFRPPLIFGHFLLAAAGLVVWIIYVIADMTALAWAAFIIIALVALLGFTMFARWLSVARARVPVPAGAPSAAGGSQAVPAERDLPVPIVAAHGLLAATTLVLVLLSAIGIGS